MSNAVKYKLSFSQQSLPFNQTVKLYQAKSQDDSPFQLYALHNGMLYKFQFKNGIWMSAFSVNNFPARQLYFAGQFSNGKSIMLGKTDVGVNFYELKSNELNLLAQSDDFEENQFDDIYGWTVPGSVIKFGHFFLDRNLVGVLTNHPEYGAKLYALMEDELWNDRLPFWPLDTNLDMLGNTFGATFALSDLTRNGQENVIVHGSTGLNIYKMDENFNLKIVMKVPNTERTDTTDESWLFFPHLTGQSFRDIVLLNSSGLFVYQYNDRNSNYRSIDYQSSFARVNGWKQENSASVHFTDIDSDGRDEMFFTGPQGINLLSYSEKNRLKSTLDSSSLTIAERHSDVVNVLSFGKQSMLFTMHKNQLRWSNIVKIQDTDDDNEKNVANTKQTDVITYEEEPLEVEFEPIPMPVDKTFAPPIYQPTIYDKKSILLLREQLDTLFKNQMVDDHTGKLKFKLPLLDLNNFDIKFDLFYDDSSQESDILGMGWSMPQNSIMVDFQASIFPEDTSYYLITQDLPQPLIFDSKSSSENRLSFKIKSDTTNVQIHYHKNDEQWEVIGNNIKQIYGRMPNKGNDAIAWSVAWNNWHGIGSSKTDQKQFAYGWHLLSVERGEYILTYNYDIVSVPIPNGMHFTREINLRQINDNQGNGINFHYAAKSAIEYDLPSTIDEDGNLNMATVQTRYLTGYHVITPSFEQNIEFRYTVKNGKRLLTEIQQNNDIINGPVLQFVYEQLSKSYMLKSIVLPTDVTLEFDYALHGRDISHDAMQEKRYDVEDRHRVDYGDNFVLISYIDSIGRVILRISNHEMTIELYSSLSYENSTKLPRFGDDGKYLKSYEIKLMDNTILIILRYVTDDTDIFLLHRDENKWSQTPTNLKYDKTAMIAYGRDFIVAAEYGSSINIISWNRDSKQWIKTLAFNAIRASKDLLLQTDSDRKIVIYDNHRLLIGYKNQADQWQFKTIKHFPGVIDEINYVISKFQLNEERRDQLTEFFKGLTLQISQNLLIINRLKVDGMTVHSLINLMVLNDAYEIATNEQYQLFQENLLQYTTKSVTPVGDTVTIAFHERDSKIKAYAASIRGNYMDSINEISSAEDRAKIKQEYFDRATENIEKNIFPEFIKYAVVLKAPYVFLSKKRLIFNGHNCTVFDSSEAESTKHDIRKPLADKFVLRQENENTSIKLYEQTDDKNDRTKLGKFLVDLNVKNFNQIISSYPFYLAYQQPMMKANVILFSNHGQYDQTFELPWIEILSPFSSHNTIVTSINNTDARTSKTLVFRKLNPVGPYLPNPVIKNAKIKFLEENHRLTRTIEREYHDGRALGNAVFYERVSVIPHNKKETYGWIDDILKISEPKSGVRRVFNSQGKLIKTIKPKRNQAKKDDSTENQNELRLSSTLFDKTGRLEVAHFLPYEMDDDEVGFYGFEDYENNKSSISERKWWFEEDDVVNDGFSLTGRNYLSLSGNSLNATFRPNDQNQEYVASCWLRSENQSFKLGDMHSGFKVILSDENQNATFPMVIGEVKLQIADWYYLEIIINFLSTKLVHQTDDKPIYLSQLMDGDSTATIIISSSQNDGALDVDHVRFSPMNNRFKANIYDSKTNQLKEIITTDGLIERNIYDKYQNQIAHFNAYGDMKEFNTYTKVTSIGRIPQPKCIVAIQPMGGFYEDFSPYSFSKHWLSDSQNDWRISSGQLHHLTNASHDLMLRLSNIDINQNSYGIRLNYALQSIDAMIQWNSDLKMIQRNDGTADIILLGHAKRIPLDGEILLTIENTRIFIWIDGGLYFDSITNESLFNLKISGRTKISDVMVFSSPSIQVTYVNALNDKLQEISMESENSIIVTDYLYDELGRQIITTKPAQLIQSQTESLLIYQSNFVENRSPYTGNSVQQIGELFGKIAQVNGKYAFTQTKYCDHPLNEKCIVGLPGKEFSIGGPFAKHFSYSTDDLFINNLFPIGDHFSYQIEHKPGHVEDISVLNNDGKRVAWYVRVENKKDLLSTNEYDENGNLIMTLPPLFHEQVGTFYKLDSNIKSTSYSEKLLRDALGAKVQYNDKGNVINKTTPDGGKTEFIYDKFGLLTFEVHFSNSNHENIENVIYFEYDKFGRLRNTGHIISPVSKETLKTSELSDKDKNIYQMFKYDYYKTEPILRGKTTRTITYNNGEPLIEESMINIDEQITNKRIIIPKPNNDDNDDPIVIEVAKAYSGGTLKMIEYPIDVDGQPFRVTYQYDKFGRITNVGSFGSDKSFASYTYNSDGQIASEMHSPGTVNGFNRQYNYNSAGFLTRLHDKFLTESVYYTEGGYGYGSAGRNDGTIVRTKFDATWHEYADERELGLNERSFVSTDVSSELSTLCFNEFKRLGYINDANRLAKAYYPELETNLPISCNYGVTGRQIQRILGKKGFPNHYGHSYDYGNYQELTKAKYFVNDEEPIPLQPNSFANEIPGLNMAASHDIWNKLKTSKFLIQFNDKFDVLMSHGKIQQSLIRHTLEKDLYSLQENYRRYKLPLEKILIETISQKKYLSTLKSTLKDAFLRWSAGVKREHIELTANKIFEMLERKNYFKNPLADELVSALKPYEPFIHDIVRVVAQHFATSLGETEFDVESFDIDANGNHKLFYAGFERYEMTYRNNTNQIDSVNIRSSVINGNGKGRKYTMKHDGRGNVVQALHKGIEHIEYHAVSNRATKIQLVDGRTLTFYYDANGERIYKNVKSSVGKTTKEIHYIRDELGRTLVQREINYIVGASKPDVLITAYIYGPKGLLGFIRRDEFYSIVSDHEGSTRLVIKNGEVVAAYDYLPYGNLMREYQSNLLGNISIRYTGQEWDEEIDLYNYHARFYDPSIGRFYQIDPREQYFSPYKYAGNSPISIIDPDGEFAFLLLFCILFAIAGAYLGAAVANKTLDPTKWKWDSWDTYLGLLTGGITGAFIPIGFVGSAGVIGGWVGSTAIGYGITGAMGAGGAYLGMAAANHDIDPTKWDLASPETWSGGFHGFGMASGIIGSGAYTVSKYQNLQSLWSKGLFIATGTIGGGGLFIKNGFDHNWDFSKPDIYFGILVAADSSINLPVFVTGIAKSIAKNGNKIMSGINASRNGYKMIENGRSITGYRYAATTFTKSSLKGVGMVAIAIALTAAQNDLDFSDFNTYFGIVQNMAMTQQHFELAKKYVHVRKHRKAIKENNVKSKLLCRRRRVTSYASMAACTVVKEASGKIESSSIDNQAGSSRKHAEQAQQEKLNTLKRYAKEMAEEANKSYHVELGQKGKLRDEKIPNTMVSVAMSETHGLVAYSSNKAPGYAALFEYDADTGPVMKKGKYLKKNDDIKGEIVSSVHEETRKIYDSSDKTNKSRKKKALQGAEYQEFQKKLEQKWFKTELLSDSKMIKNLKNRITKHMKMKLENNDFPDFARLHKWLNDIDLHEQKHSAPNDGKMQGKKNNGFDKKKKIFLDDKKAFLNELNKFYKDDWPNWPNNNCGEAHVLTLAHRAKDVFESKPIVGEIEYLATFRTKNLEPAERCLTCKTQTKHIRYILTDPTVEPVNTLPDDFSKHRTRRSILNDKAIPIAKSGTFQDDVNRISEKIVHSNIGEPMIKAATKPYTHTSSLYGLLQKGIQNVQGLLGKSYFNNRNDTQFESEKNPPVVKITQFDSNGALMLLDMIVRKFSGEKPISSKDADLSVSEANAYGIQITENFEKIIRRAAKKSHISVCALSIDFPKVQSEITRKIVGGKYKQIFGILSSYAKNACIEQMQNSEYSAKMDDIDYFMSILEEMLDRLIDKILTKITNNKTEVSTLKAQHESNVYESDAKNDSQLNYNVPLLDHI